jgi:hypothetical protein
MVKNLLKEEVLTRSGLYAQGFKTKLGMQSGSLRTFFRGAENSSHFTATAFFAAGRVCIGVPTE